MLLLNRQKYLPGTSLQCSWCSLAAVAPGGVEDAARASHQMPPNVDSIRARESVCCLAASRHHQQHASHLNLSEIVLPHGEPTKYEPLAQRANDITAVYQVCWRIKRYSALCWPPTNLPHNLIQAHVLLPSLHRPTASNHCLRAAICRDTDLSILPLRIQPPIIHSFALCKYL